MPVPLDFQEAVKLAQAGGRRGDLRLLAHEAQGFEWESEGLRLVGNAQFRLKAFRGRQGDIRIAAQDESQGRARESPPRHDLPETRGESADS